MTVGDYLVFVVVVGIIAGTLGGVAASEKNRTVVGWVTICFLFPFMILPLFCLSKIEPPPLSESTGSSNPLVKCPNCKEMIGSFAIACRHCGQALEKERWKDPEKPYQRPKPNKHQF